MPDLGDILYIFIVQDSQGSKFKVSLTGILQSCGMKKFLPPAILKKAKACIIGLLKDNVTFAVNVGNTSKK